MKKIICVTLSLLCMSAIYSLKRAINVKCMRSVYLVSEIILISLLVGGCSKNIESNRKDNCHCSFEEYTNIISQYKNNDEVDGGYKPVIFYNDKLYWLDTEKNERLAIPENFDFIGKLECVTSDPYTLPNKQLESNQEWGTEVYADKNGKFLYCHNNGYISKFIREDLIHE